MTHLIRGRAGCHVYILIIFWLSMTQSYCYKEYTETYEKEIHTEMLRYLIQVWPVVLLLSKIFTT